MKGEMRFHVARPAEEVFDFLVDLRNEVRWNPRALSIEQVTPGPIGTGSQFHGRYRAIGVVDTVLTDCDRPTRIAFRSTGPKVEIEGAFGVRAAAGGTDVALDADLRMRGLLRYLAPLMAPVLRLQNAAAARRLAAVLDG